VKLKKKIIVATIATSVAATALSVAPFSEGLVKNNKGLIGISFASEKEAFPNAEFLAKMQKIQAALAAGGAQEDVRALRSAIQSLGYDVDGGILEPIYSKLPDGLKDDESVKIALFNLFKAVGTITYDPQLTALEAIRKDPNFREVLHKLEVAGGVDDLTVDDIVTFIAASETALINQVAKLDDALLAILLLNKNGEQTALLKEVVAEVLNKDLQVSKVFNKLFDDKAVDVLPAFIDGIKTNLPEYKAASKAMLVAYVRSEVQDTVSTTNNGRTQTYTLKIKNVNVPSSALVWEKKVGDDSSITVSPAGVVTLSSSASTGKATISAKLVGTDRVIFEKEVTLTYSSDIVYESYPAVDSSSSIVNELNALKDKIAKASDEEKAKLIEEAVDKASKAIENAAKLDVSKAVVVDADGKAVLNANQNDIAKAIKNISEIISALKAAAPGAEAKLPNITITLNLGEVSASDVTVNVPADSISKAIEAGIYGFAFVESGLHVTVPVGGSINDKLSFSVNKSEPTAEVIGQLQAASKVYDFNLTVGDKAVTRFAKPVIVRIPLKDISNLDSELLSVAKIVDGELVFEGGVVEGNTIVEPRDSFSSYVVVENKVKFNDIAKVQSWAGRQIEVMAAKGAIVGKEAGIFAPNDQVTRAEFTKMLIRALNLENGLAEQQFNDVSTNDWFGPYVAAAAEKGIIKGRTANEFSPKATITRAEIAAMLARAIEVANGVKASEVDSSILDKFKDAGDIHASLKEGVAFAASKGLIIGNNGKLSPKANATRAEAAVMIYRAINQK